MSKFRKIKSELRQRLLGPDWAAALEELGRVQEPQEYVGPLMALLPQAGLLHWRGVSGLGIIVPALAGRNMEEARVVMRRFMWHMNEESGNLGWGIPESMAEILAHSPALAREFSRVLFSYVLDSGRDDNYIDYAPLLRWCFWGAGHLARARPDLCGPEQGGLVVKSFVDGLEHEEALVRAQAALALLKLLEAAPELGQSLAPEEALRAQRLLDDLSGDETECEDYDGQGILYRPAGNSARRALDLLKAQ